MTDDNNDNRIELIGLNEFTKAADAVQELRNMADRELASDARKAHAEVTEAHAEVTEAVAELMAIAENQKAEIKRLRAECDEANKRIRQLLGDTEQLELTVARLTEDLRRMDAVITLVYVGIEKRKLREEGTS